MNKAQIIGHLGGDVELRKTTGGTSVASFNVATNEVWSDDNNTRHTHTEWHTVVVWANRAENCSKYLRKGSMVYVEGVIRTRKWTDSNNIERSVKEIIASNVEFLDKKKTEDAPADTSAAA